MNSRSARHSLVAMVAALSFCGLSIAEDLLPPKVAEGLQAEVHAARPLFNPDGAIRVRFALLNASPETIAVPLSSPMAQNVGVALPNELALGSSESPAISIRFEDEPPVLIDDIPEWRTPRSRGARRLRIGPHGMVGTEIDLRRYYPRVRYPGRYVVEWRPFGDQLAVAQATFRVEQRQEAIIVTDYGKMTFSLAYDAAPKNVNNFLELVGEAFYDGLTFHRVVPGFVIQGGCPKGNGTGIRPDGKLVEAEFHDAPVEIGTLLMARKPSDPNSASCQFFVALSRLDDLDQEYTVIGQADDDASVRTLQRIAGVSTNRQGEPIEPVTIRSVNLVNVEEARVHSLERDTAGEVESAPKDAPAKKTSKKSGRSRK